MNANGRIQADIARHGVWQTRQATEQALMLSTISATESALWSAVDGVVWRAVRDAPQSAVDEATSDSTRANIAIQSATWGEADDEAHERFGIRNALSIWIATHEAVSNATVDFDGFYFPSL